MTYKTLMAHLDTGGDNEGVLKVAGELAERFIAKVIGIAARLSEWIFGGVTADVLLDPDFCVLLSH